VAASPFELNSFGVQLKAFMAVVKMHQYRNSNVFDFSPFIR